MIYRIRVTAYTDKGHVFRDIETDSSVNLEDLNNVIQQSFGLDGMEMASFYTLDDELNTLDEIPLFPMEEGKTVSMDKVRLEEVLNPGQPKLAYVYDYLNMWQFLVELLEQSEDEDVRLETPQVVYSKGQLPDEPPQIQFDIKNIDEIFDDDLENFRDDFDEYYDPDEWE